VTVSQVGEGGRLAISREEAIRQGRLRFYTGRVCRSAHWAERYVSNRQCVECNAERAVHGEWSRSSRDPTYRLYRSVHRRSGQYLRGRASPATALGCDKAALRIHIEKQFTVGMCWEKYGQWEVDHRVPLSAARSLQRLRELCHFTNLQPLWKQENIKKGGA